MKIITLFILSLLASSIAIAGSPQICQNHDKFFRDNIIKFEEFTCDHKNECVVTALFPDSYENTDFYKIHLKSGDWKSLELFLSLETYESNLKGRATVLLGRKEILEKSELYITYKPLNGCYYWSLVELKHNKRLWSQVKY